MEERETLKDRLERIPQRLPLVADANDPIVAVALWGVFFLAVAGLIWAHDIFPGDHEAPTHIIQTVGGIVVLFGSYFAANRLAVQRRQQRVEALSKLFEQLGSSEPAVCIGAIRLMQGVALQPAPNRTAAREAQRETRAVRDALNALLGRPNLDPSVAIAINEVLEELPDLGDDADDEAAPQAEKTS